MALIVQKYGGSSLATPKHILEIAFRIRQVKALGKDVVVIVSAMGRMTDHLIELARKTVRNPPQRELDMLMTAGERISMALLAMALEERAVPAISFTGSQSGIVTSAHHTEARIVEIRAHRIREELSKGKVVIVAGFQGVSRDKEITTLGRGGSDTTAVAMAAALGADECEILTDVDGLFSADPRLVPTAQLIDVCSYDEALELAWLGAKMHPRSIDLARRHRVRVRIASSAKSDGRGTRLVNKIDLSGGDMEEARIRGVTTMDGFHFFRANVTIDNLLSRLRVEHFDLRFIQWADEIRFLIESRKADRIRAWFRELGCVYAEFGEVSAVSVVGDGLTAAAYLLTEILDALQSCAGSCHLISSNSMSLTVAVPTTSAPGLARDLHRRLVEKEWGQPQEVGPKLAGGEAEKTRPASPPY